MKYSAGIRSDCFWFQESKKTASYIVEGLNKEDLRKVIIDDNVYQVNNTKKAKRILSRIVWRFDAFSDDILNQFLKTDVNSAKVFVLISIMSMDKLFFEFMNEVVKDHIILGNYQIDKKDVLLFLENKQFESEIISNWTEHTIDALSTLYLHMLEEAGIYDRKTKNLILPLIDPTLESLLKEEGFDPLLETINI